jgi:hypothetical protein
MVTTNTAGQNILKGVMTYNKIEQMKKNDSWKGSLIDEEAYQIGTGLEFTRATCR